MQQSLTREVETRRFRCFWESKYDALCIVFSTISMLQSIVFRRFSSGALQRVYTSQPVNNDHFRQKWGRSGRPGLVTGLGWAQSPPHEAVRGIPSRSAKRNGVRRLPVTSTGKGSGLLKSLNVDHFAKWRSYGFLCHIIHGLWHPSPRYSC